MTIGRLEFTGPGELKEVIKSYCRATELLAGRTSWKTLEL